MFIIKKLYEEYKQDVFRYLVSLTHDVTLSEDLVSETFLSAIKSFSRYKGEANIKTWLFSIARHKWYEHIRKEKSTVDLEELSMRYVTSGTNVEREIICKAISNRIEELLEKESEQTKRIVHMRIEGYSFYEIALACHISESSARVIEFRAKKKIRESLAEEGLTYE